MEEDKNDDDITLDLSKVTGFLKGRSKNKREAADKEEKETTVAGKQIPESKPSEEKKPLSGTENPERSDDEISFDFSKIKSFFRSKAKPKAERSESASGKGSVKDEEDLSIDFASIKNFCSSRRFSLILILILILIPMYFAVDFRMMSADLPVTEDWARNSVYNNVRSQITNQIRAESPNLPPQSIEREVNRRFQQALEAQGSQIEQGIKQTAAHFRSALQDDDGQTYLLAIDPYQYFRYAQDVIEHGYPGDTIRNSKPYDMHMQAPIGTGVDRNFHIYFGAYMYKLLDPFTDKSVMGIFFLLPVIISALAVIPAFLIGRKLGGNVGGFFAALILAVHGTFLSRTPGGFSDTDAYNVFFPLLIVWLFLEAFDAEKIKQKLLFSSLAGLSVGLFAFSWAGSWFIFDILVAAGIIYLAYLAIVQFKAKSKLLEYRPFLHNVYALLAFIVSSAIFVTLFRNFRTFTMALRGPLEFISIKEVASFKIWPNVYTTVAELNTASYASVIDQMGGKIFFLIALIGIILLISRKKFGMFEGLFAAGSFVWYFVLIGIRPENIWFLILLAVPIVLGVAYAIVKKYQDVDIKYALVLIIWFIATIYAGKVGVRFSLLLVPAFAVAFGIGIGLLYRHLVAMFHQGFQIPKWTVQLTIILLALVIIGAIPSIGTGPTECPFIFKDGFMCRGFNTALNEIPTATDAWWEALEYIKHNSEEDAIINSWWDFGHWFKAIADRAVTFDGASQNAPQAHWIGKTLLTDDEEIAVGILRMLDCGSNKAFDKLDKSIQDIPESVDILNHIIVEDKEKAAEILADHGLDERQIQDVLENTHCDPPEDFFIASEDMIGKSGVWGHFGSWDFYKAQMYQAVKKKKRMQGIELLQTRFNKTEDEASELYYQIQSTDADHWVSPWPGYMTADWFGCNPAVNSTVLCNPNMIMQRNEVQDIILESVIVNLDDVDRSRLKISARNRATNEIQGQEAQVPQSIVIIGQEGVEEHKMENATFEFSLVLSQDANGNYRALFTDSLHANSMFLRLFFTAGHGLRYFDLVKHTTTVTGQDIYVYKVDWEGRSRTNIYTDNRVHVRHILACSVNDTNCPDNRTEKEAEKLIKGIRRNVTRSNFADLAEKYSDDKASAVYGGDLGWISKGMLVPEFEEVAFDMDEGEISDPIRSEFGYHIIYVEEKGAGLDET